MTTKTMIDTKQDHLLDEIETLFEKQVKPLYDYQDFKFCSYTNTITIVNPLDYLEETFLDGNSDGLIYVTHCSEVTIQLNLDTNEINVYKEYSDETGEIKQNQDLGLNFLVTDELISKLSMFFGIVHAVSYQKPIACNTVEMDSDLDDLFNLDKLTKQSWESEENEKANQRFRQDVARLFGMDN